MKTRRVKVSGLLILFLLLLAVAACGRKIQDDNSQDIRIIGVSVYNQEDPEMRMFMNYYQDYVTEGFPVKFYFSDVITSTEDELAFIDSMKEQGAEGLISFYGQDLKRVVEHCAANEMYCVLGSGTVSDETYDAIKDNEWFVGTIGPAPASEYEAGQSMAEYFAKEGAKSYLVVTGGSQMGNFMHLSRAEGMLDTLKDEFGLTYDNEEDVLTNSQENIVLDTGNKDISITVCPGYLSREEGRANLEAALEDNDYDALLSTLSLASVMDKVLDKEESQGKELLVGVVDCFSAENAEAVKDDDAYGHPQIDFVAGKYSSMAGPAFAMLYNAITGYPEANSTDGKAVRYYQGFWMARGRSEYLEYYSYTQGDYENAYSNADLMNTIHEFNEDSQPEGLKKLTEAYTIEDVKARISVHK